MSLSANGILRVVKYKPRRLAGPAPRVP
jgi:hypothetical protein